MANEFNIKNGFITSGNSNVYANLNVTGGLSASTVTISNTPTTNTTDTSVLVRNSTSGNIEVRSINNLINENNTVTVALTGSTGVDFNSIKDAVNSITAATSANTYTVKVAGGLYLEDPFTIPSWVAVVGDSSLSTIIQANDASQTLINLSDQSALFDCQVQGCTGTSVAAIVYSSSTTPQSSAISYVENVRFGANYTHAKVVAYGGANIIMQCSNVKYGGYPFTIGFYTTNSGSGIGRMQLRNVTSTNGGITTTSGLIFAKTDAASCGFIVNGCLLTKAAGAAAGTGFYVENGGFLRLTAVNFQRWAVGIDAPQIGAAPSIDAIALNFENNTIDVNIAHSGATGKIQGTDTYTKTNINIDAPLYEVNQDPRIITVAKKGGDFTSVKSAVDSLTATSVTSRYVVKVGPGIFQEGEIDLTSKPYVSVIGSDIQATIITPLTSTQNIFSLGTDTELSFMTISGASTGYAGISCVDLGGFALVHKLSMYDNDTHILVDSTTADSTFYGEYVDLNGEYTYGTKVTSDNGFTSLANMENYYNFPSGTGVTYCNYASGSGATISVFVGDTQSNGVSGSTAYYIQDYAELNASTITSDGFTYGIRNPNVGGGIRFDVDNASFVNGEWDLYVEKVDTFGTLAGSSNHEKLYTNSTNVTWSILDINDGEFEITRKASVTFPDGTHTDFTTLIFEGGSMGVISGGTLGNGGGTDVEVDAGFGYLEKSNNSGVVKRIDWNFATITLTTDSDLYIYYNENGILSSSGTRPDSRYNIVLGRVVTDSSQILFIEQSPFDASHTSNSFGSLFREALGPIYAFGSIVTEGLTPFTLNVTQGEYYYSTNEYTPSGGTGITFTQYYKNSPTTWQTSATTLVNHTQYDNNGTLTGLTTSAYTKHTLYTVGDGINEQFMLVFGQNEYTTLVEAENALLPTPPNYFTDAVAQVASIYVRQGSSNIIQIEDIRPTVGFRAGGVNASSVHGNLLGLTADDHLQYLLVDGGRAMSGDLNMGSNNITNTGTVNGVTVETHATRHQFGGADPVGTTTPSPNAIPFADVSGTLDSWTSTATTTTLGKVKLSTSPVSASNPIALGENDLRFQKSFTGGSYTTGTLSLNNNTGGTVSITGFIQPNATFNYIPKLSATTTFANSQIYDDGSLVGINAITPIYGESISFQTFNKGMTLDSTYIIETGNGSIAIATGNDYSTWAGSGEIAIGTRGPLRNSTGSGNIAIGDKALEFNTTGINNIAIGGTVTLGNNTDGISNIALGVNSMTQNTLGGENIAIGEGSLYNNISGNTNVVIGVGAGFSNTIKDRNVYIGQNAGYSNDGENNIFIGFAAGYGDTSSNNRLNIGETIYGDISSKLIGINQANPVTTLDVGGTLRVSGGLTAGTISATTYYNLPSASFTGGTVTGPTIFTNGLSANTISATTYNNLPVSGLTQGTGISVTNNGLGGYTIANTDRGSAENIFKNIQIAGVTQFSANSNTANLNFSGINITITSGASNTLILSAATGGGGGGTPGGIETSVQYNNGAGGFAGASNVVIDVPSNNLRLVSTTDPTPPGAGNVIIYSKDIAGRQMPKWIGPSGVDTPFQSNIMFNNVSVIGPGGATTVGTIGCTVTNVGTISNPNVASTTLKSQTRRITNTSAATAGSLASTRVASLECLRGNNTNIGGFFVVARFGLATLQSGMRMFIGLTDTATTAPTNIDPTTSTTPGKIGMAINANTGNWNLVHNITGSAPTVIPLGASYPVDATTLYELVLFAIPADTVVKYRITNMTTETSTSGTLSTNLPASTTPLGRVCWATNNATAAAVAWDLSRFSLETDY